jgi:hypothetical protein
MGGGGRMIFLIVVGVVCTLALLIGFLGGRAEVKMHRETQENLRKIQKNTEK